MAGCWANSNPNDGRTPKGRPSIRGRAQAVGSNLQIAKDRQNRSAGSNRCRAEPTLDSRLMVDGSGSTRDSEPAFALHAARARSAVHGMAWQAMPFTSPMKNALASRAFFMVPTRPARPRGSHLLLRYSATAAISSSVILSATACITALSVVRSRLPNDLSWLCR